MMVNIVTMLMMMMMMMMVVVMMMMMMMMVIIKLLNHSTVNISYKNNKSLTNHMNTYIN